MSRARPAPVSLLTRVGLGFLLTLGGLGRDAAHPATAQEHGPWRIAPHEADTAVWNGILGALPEPGEPESDSLRGRSWMMLPFASYAPETSLSFGVLFAWIRGEPDDPDRVRTSLMTNARYTLKSQVVAGVELEARPAPEWFVLAEGNVKLRWPDRFYQPGNRTAREAHEEWTSRGVDLRGRFLHQVGSPHLFVGPVVGASYLELLEVEEGGILDAGAIRGASDHGLLGMGLAATWDSRSSPVYPHSGSFHSVSLTGYRSLHGPRAVMVRGEADLRAYRSLGASTVLALRGRLRAAGGDVPFTMHTGIGGMGGGLRGIFENRYADRTGAVGVAELRQSLFWRVGCVAFAGAGEVASGPGKLSVKGLHGAGGGGLRFRLLPASGLNVGVDFAMGEGESNLYFLLGEVF